MQVCIPETNYNSIYLNLQQFSAMFQNQHILSNSEKNNEFAWKITTTFRFTILW